MSRTALLDTNYLLDLVLAERPGHAAALMLFDEISLGELRALVCATSLKDAYYVASKYADEPSARKLVASMLEFFHIANVDEAICLSAISSNEPDFEDGIICACAEAAQVDFIISRDEGAFARSRLKRLSAQDYLDLFAEREETGL